MVQPGSINGVRAAGTAAVGIGGTGFLAGVGMLLGFIFTHGAAGLFIAGTVTTIASAMIGVVGAASLQKKRYFSVINKNHVASGIKTFMRGRAERNSKFKPS